MFLLSRLGIDVADVSDLSSEETDSEESSRDSRSEAVESGESSKVSIEITSTPDVADSLGSFPEETDSKEKTAVKSNSNTKCGLLAQLPPPVNAGNDLEKKIETHKQVVSSLYDVHCCLWADGGHIIHADASVLPIFVHSCFCHLEKC